MFVGYLSILYRLYDRNLQKPTSMMVLGIQGTLQFQGSSWGLPRHTGVCNDHIYIYIDMQMHLHIHRQTLCMWQINKRTGYVRGWHWGCLLGVSLVCSSAGSLMVEDVPTTQLSGLDIDLAVFWPAVKTLTFWGFYRVLRPGPTQMMVFGSQWY